MRIEDNRFFSLSPREQLFAIIVCLIVIGFVVLGFVLTEAAFAEPISEVPAWLRS